MKKLDYFLAAMHAKLFLKKAWVISAFSTINEAPTAWQENPYQYRLVQNPAGHFYVSVPVAGPPTLVQITDAEPNVPLFRFLESISLPAATLPNLATDVVTTLGNVFFNYCCLCYAFGSKIPFIAGDVKMESLETYLAERLTDTPPEGAERRDDKIYVDEYIRFADSVHHLTNYTQLCVWSATPKTLTAAPGIIEYRKKLIEENKERLHDPAVIGAIDAKLVAFDAEYLKGDPGENFLLSKKSREIVRKKIFMMHGAEVGLEESVSVDLIQNSLSEGWDLNKFASYNDSLRAGSFNRGAQTELGGESVKWLLRASSNITVVGDDCGSTLGVETVVNQADLKSYVGFTFLTTDGKVKIEKTEDCGPYLGKKIMVRSPMYCKLDKTDYCITCTGDKLSSNPTGLSLAVSEYGSAFLGIFMKAAHAKSLSLAKMDYKTAIF